MRYLVIKHFYRSYINYQLELLNIFYKYILTNLNLPLGLRAGIMPSLFVASIKRRCLYTGRARSVVRYFKAVRMQLYCAGSAGKLNGLRLSS